MLLTCARMSIFPLFVSPSAAHLAWNRADLRRDGRRVLKPEAKGTRGSALLRRVTRIYLIRYPREEPALARQFGNGGGDGPQPLAP